MMTGQKTDLAGARILPEIFITFSYLRKSKLPVIQNTPFDII